MKFLRETLAGCEQISLTATKVAMTEHIMVSACFYIKSKDLRHDSNITRDGEYVFLR